MFFKRGLKKLFFLCSDGFGEAVTTKKYPLCVLCALCGEKTYFGQVWA